MTTNQTTSLLIPHADRYVSEWAAQLDSAIARDEEREVQIICNFAFGARSLLLDCPLRQQLVEIVGRADAYLLRRAAR